MENLNDIFRRSREASRALLAVDDQRRSAAITTLASLIESRQADLLEANARDLSRMEPHTQIRLGQ